MDKIPDSNTIGIRDFLWFRNCYFLWKPSHFKMAFSLSIFLQI